MMYYYLSALILIVHQISLALSQETSTTMIIDSAINRASDSKHGGENSVRCGSNPNHAWCLPEDYTSEESPFQHHALSKDKPLPWKYNFTFVVKDIRKIDDKAQSISITMYFAVRWFEPRLVINENAEAWSSVQLGPVGEVTISTHNLKNFWYPELEIYGIDSFRRYNVLKDMAGLRIRKDQTINYEVKSEITISCKMDFDNYPLDNQKCFFQVGSYYGSEETIQCESNLTYDVRKQKNIQHLVELGPLPMQNRSIELSSGNYAVCGFSIHLTRKRMQSLVQVYMPCCMFVIASWISFVVKPDLVPGRMALLVTILLVQLNLFNSSKDKGPESSSHINAIDLYLVFSMFLVFSALLQYAIILVMMKILPSWAFKMVDENKRNGIKLAWDNAIKDTSCLDKTVTSTNLPEAHGKKSLEGFKILSNKRTDKSCDEQVDVLKKATETVCNKIDFISLCLAPIVFIIFNVIYCIKYL